MRAIILAAGRGTRLKPLTNSLPKCLLKIDGRPIIEHQINALKSCGIKKFCIVIGHHGDKIKSFLGERYDFVINKNYMKTNSLKSLWLARKFFDDDLLILSSDVIFEKKLIADLLKEEKGGVCICINSAFKRPGAYKVAIQKNNIVNMGIDLKDEDVSGESGEIIKIKKYFLPNLKIILQILARRNPNHYWAEDAFLELVNYGIKLNYFDVKNYFWYEFDTAKEWRYANEAYRLLTNK
jgi:choline kinase